MNEVINKQSAPAYSWGKVCTSWILKDEPLLSIKHELMPPGTKEQLHFHEKANQFFYVLNGKATFYLEQEILQLTAYDGLTVKCSQKHFIANESDENTEFLVISQPNITADRINI